MEKIKALKNGYLRISKKELKSHALKNEAIERTFKRIAKINDIKSVVLVNKASNTFYYFMVELIF